MGSHQALEEDVTVSNIPQWVQDALADLADSPRENTDLADRVTRLEKQVAELLQWKAGFEAGSKYRIRTEE